MRYEIGNGLLELQKGILLTTTPYGPAECMGPLAMKPLFIFQ